MHSVSLKFCERAGELGTIIKRWHLASSIERPTPQIIVIKAERGVGKTRLALEFYRWLSETVDSVCPDGYWPNAATIIEKNLEPNPEPRECRFSIPIPYLWWGLRAGDRGAENGVAGDAIAAYDRFLCPHLVALLVRANMTDRALGIVKAWANVGIDLASNILQVDTIVSIGKASFETAQILTGAIKRTERDDALRRSTSRADAVLADLEKVFNPKAHTYARTPAVIFLDDAQFVHDDAALPSFVERLMYKAMSERWPVMFLVTHWRREFSFELMPHENCFVGILRHGRERKPTDHGPAAGVPGGYVGFENYAELDLNPVNDLSNALHAKLPGLSATQSSALLESTGGNPRFLEQVIEFLTENENFFENFDTAGPLTAAGLEEVLQETSTQDIFRVVLRRLRTAPEPIQEAICIASLQGVRFSNDLVDKVAQDRI